LRTGGNAELSNSVSAPSLRQRASCCQAKCTPGLSLKSERLPPRRQLIAPVSRSISYTVHVLRADISRSPFGPTSTAFVCA